MFVVHSVLVEPIVDVRLEINVVTEVSRSSRSHEEAMFVRDRVSVVEFFAGPLVVFRDKSKIVGIS